MKYTGTPVLRGACRTTDFPLHGHTTERAAVAAGSHKPAANNSNNDNPSPSPSPALRRLACTVRLLTLRTISSSPHPHPPLLRSPSYRQRAATRANLVRNLRNAAQDLAALEARQIPRGHEYDAKATAAGAAGADAGGLGWRKESPALIAGSSVEARTVCLALEQCLFHRIRAKDFGKEFFCMHPLGCS